jgi:hypothetical protein
VPLGSCPGRRVALQEPRASEASPRPGGRVDSLASGGRPWRPFTSLPLASGGVSSTSGAGAKHMQLAACVGGVIGRSGRPLLGLTPVSGPYKGHGVDAAG